MSEKKLSQEEQLELFQLMLYRTLLSTKVEDWQDKPTEFIELAIPKPLTEFLKNVSDPKNVLNGIITDLVCRGIASVAKDTKSMKNIELMISNLFEENGTPQ